MDLIERQTATDAVQGIGRLATLPDNDAVIRMSAVEYVLFNLPSAQPEPQWIPCSERLPEVSGAYLCTNECGWSDVGTNVWMGKNWLYEDEEPIAWMPLPEPYKENQS